MRLHYSPFRIRSTFGLSLIEVLVYMTVLSLCTLLLISAHIDFIHYNSRLNTQFELGQQLILNLYSQ